MQRADLRGAKNLAMELGTDDRYAVRTIAHGHLTRRMQQSHGAGDQELYKSALICYVITYVTNARKPPRTT